MDIATIAPPSPPASEDHGFAEVALQPPIAPATSGTPLYYVIHLLALITAIAMPAVLGTHASIAADLDVFWHLKTGQWMLQHHAVPHSDPFSWTLPGKPWQAYSWLFELLMIKLFNRFGLVSLVAYPAVMLVAIMTAIQHLIRRLQPSFGISILLMVTATLGMSHLTMPRPWMFTILFFVFELDILMYARKTGKTRELLWLPLIFALWSNLHIEFIDGVLVLGLAVAESLMARFIPQIKTGLRTGWIAPIFAASALATLINPFGWRVYGVVFDYTSRLAAQASALNTITELQANPFRDIGNYCVLFLTMAAAAIIARQRRFLFFETGLLLFAAVESFRSQRDVWLVVLAAAAILAIGIPERRNAAVPQPRRVPLLLATPVAALLVLVSFRANHLDQQILTSQIAKILPVRAVEAIQAGGYTGLLFNDYNWGGYLMWALDKPVSIDGRASFYGDEAISRSMTTWGGGADWASDPALKSAAIVIGPYNSPLAQLLRTDQHFRNVYEDKIATVFVRER